MPQELPLAPIAGSWDTALLEPMSELNEQLLDAMRLMALTAPAAAGDGDSDSTQRARPPQLIASLREDWCRLDSAAQRRMAACPYLLLDAGFGQHERWEPSVVLGVRERSGAAPLFAGRGGVALVHRTLLLAWHVARSNRLMARVALGMTARSAECIAACRLRDLEALAELSPGWIAPRWERQPNVWQQLIAAACRNNPAQLRVAQLRGLQLLAGGAGLRVGARG